MNLSNLDVHAEKLTNDFWLLDRNGIFIAFSPLGCLAFEVKPKGINALCSHFQIGENPEIEKFLITNGFYNKHKINGCDENKPFSPGSVVLSLTSGCNLRCIYCYANAGNHFLAMEEEIGKTAIDYTLENAIRSNKKKAQIIFHGGGEPMFVWPLMMELTEYATNKWGNLVRFSAVTNATLITPDRADWLSKYKFRISVSLDGPQSVQDYQRPMNNHHSSFAACYRGVSLLQERGIEYGIRATVTKKGTDKIEDLVKIAADLSCGLKLEPFTAVGRGANNVDDLRADPVEFAESFLIAKSLGNKLGVEVKTSFVNNQAPGENYCAGNGNMFVVTPSGDISSCSRATQASDIAADKFFIGKIEKNKITIYPNKVKDLRRLKPENFQRMQ